MSRHYKDYHIRSMHSNGTTAYETLFVMFPPVFYTFLVMLFVSLISTYINMKRKWQFLLEFLTLILPILLNLTVFADYFKDVILSLFAVVVALILFVYNVGALKSKLNDNKFKTNFLTNARAIASLLTVLAILAVDFRVFPRRFAKTETFGYSLMDTGVGLFMFSNGILAPESRGKKYSIMKSIKTSLPLFILGTARFVTTKQTDYNVPVSEYGVHWNFFITLAFTKMFSSFILNIVNIKYIYVNAVFILTAHEILLQTGLQNFVLLDTKRDNFITANKEGLVSCLGYVSIYLFAVYFGYLLDIKNNNQSKVNLAFKFIIGSLLTLTLTIILNKYFIVSRRLANSTYCFWIVFCCISVLGLCYLVQVIYEFVCKDKFPNYIYSPLILESINYNGLAYFLLANILTGLINISINTLLVSDSMALLILALYMFINCSVVTCLYYKQIKMKL